MTGTMKRIGAVVLGAVMLLVSGVSVLAHEVTYKGTVAKIENRKLEVIVVDEKTKKESKMPFELTSRTKIYRGDRQLKLDDVKIQKDERIVVTINHEESETQATIVRLAAAGS